MCIRDRRYESPSAFAEDLHRSLLLPDGHFADLPEDGQRPVFREEAEKKEEHAEQRHDRSPCLLYTSQSAAAQRSH